MKKIVLLYFIFIISLQCTTENNLEEYKIENIKLEKFSKMADLYDSDEIDEEYFVCKINSDELIKFMKNSNLIDNRPIWKGAFLIRITEVDNNFIYIKISYYGAFFKIIGYRSIYEINETHRDEWIKWLNNLFNNLIIPWRNKKYFIDNKFTE